ncbi:hypothetical protein [Glutamicibacter sp. JC586]|uniref:hypothetical protein n=1 Tax=Glutamicibacter sp. JC586 TaxID=2590552 RepID=UPI00135B8E1F|nr:hypothetical protein [Glutamicibacter sp. JC586]
MSTTLNEDKVKEQIVKEQKEEQKARTRDKPNSDSTKSKDHTQKRQPSNRNKYHFRDYQTCVPGTENVKGCDSNPDQSTCPDGTYPINRQLLDTKGRLVDQYQYCPGDPPKMEIPEDGRIEEAPRAIIITVEKFRSYPIKASKIQSSPNKFSLRNGHTHFWASKEVQEFKSEISDQNVKIKAIPIQWNWKYGDGAKRNLTFPGEAMPSHTLHDETKTSHSYIKTGKFGVTVTTLYRGEFSVDGGPWQAIPGQAAVPSNSLPIDVWRTEKELIAND